MTGTLGTESESVTIDAAYWACDELRPGKHGGYWSKPTVFALGWKARVSEVEALQAKVAELELLLHNNQVRREEAEALYGELRRAVGEAWRVARATARSEA